MADKDFRKLKRWELIEIIEGLQKDLQETTEENDENRIRCGTSMYTGGTGLQREEETSFQCDWNTACGGSNFSIDCNKISTGIAGFGQEHGTGIREW